MCYLELFWNIVSQGYDRQNQVILFIKKILPSHLLRDIKKTIFFIPDLKKKIEFRLQVKNLNKPEWQCLKGSKSNLDRKFEVKFFYHFKIGFKIRMGSYRKLKAGHYLEIINDKVLVISGLVKQYILIKNINLEKLAKKKFLIT